MPLSGIFALRYLLPRVIQFQVTDEMIVHRCKATTFVKLPTGTVLITCQKLNLYAFAFTCGRHNFIASV